MKLKQIAAFLGALLLITLYISTIILALMKNPISTNLLLSSILATFFVPITIYAMTLITNVLKKGEEQE